MENRNFTHNNYTFIRINKNKAKTCYNNGLTVVLCPVNLHPFNMWNNSHEVNAMDLYGNYRKFDEVLNTFEYYNCNSDAGKYTAFYIPVKNGLNGLQYDYNFIDNSVNYYKNDIDMQKRTNDIIALF